MKFSSPPIAADTEISSELAWEAFLLAKNIDIQIHSPASNFLLHIATEKMCEKLEGAGNASV